MAVFADALDPDFLPRVPSRALEHLPGSGGLPFVGNTLKVLDDPVAHATACHEAFGPVYRSHVFGDWIVNMLGPDANEVVMLDREKIFSSDQGWTPLLHLLFPRGLMLMDYDLHRAHRKALGVAFKTEPMIHYANALNVGIKTRVQAWSGTHFKFYPAIKQLTLDLAAESFLGIELGPEADHINRAFIDMVAASIAVIRKPWPGTLMAKGVKGRAFMMAFFAREIPKRRKSGGSDMFSQLCNTQHDNGQLLTDQEIMDHMNFLMMAAHDTLSSSISSMMYRLGENPGWQDRLRDEHMRLGADDVMLPYAQLSEMPLTEYVFKESLRLMAPVPSFPRRALKRFEFQGHEIPAGTWVSINPQFTHRMDAYWPSPEHFDPLRFLPENANTRHKYAWVPFGGGAHMCLGLHFAYMQTKIFFFHLLREHRIVLDAHAGEKWQVFPIPKPRDGLPLRVERL